MRGRGRRRTHWFVPFPFTSLTIAPASSRMTTTVFDAPLGEAKHDYMKCEEKESGGRTRAPLHAGVKLGHDV